MYLAPELNVLTIFTDRKMPQGTINSTITSYQPVLIASQDYYPFGMQMDSRGDNSLTTSYRFGFRPESKYLGKLLYCNGDNPIQHSDILGDKWGDKKSEQKGNALIKSADFNRKQSFS